MDFEAALAHVAFCRACEIDWHPVPRSCHPPVFLFHSSRTTISNFIAIEGGAKRREDGTEYGLLRQEGARVKWRAGNYKTVDSATVFVHKYFGSIDG